MRGSGILILDTHNSPTFRQQARAWLTLHPPSRDGKPCVVQFGSQQAVIAEFVNCPAGYVFNQPLVVRGDFQCGPGSRFEAPVYVGGRAIVGRDCILDSLCTDGDCVIGLYSQVRDWVDTQGALDLRAGAWIHGGAVSDTSIQLALDSGAPQLFSPQILTQGHFGGVSEPPRHRDLIEVGRPCDGDTPEFGAVRGFRLDKLAALGAETWAYDGSLTLPSPVWLRAKLVVRGSFSCPPGSLLEDDIKSGASLRIGAGSVIRGNLTARGELTLDADCLFEAGLRSGQSLRLTSGVRGFRADGPVDAESYEKLILEPNVVVRGRLTGNAGIMASEPALEGGMELLLAGG